MSAGKNFMNDLAIGEVSWPKNQSISRQLREWCLARGCPEGQCGEDTRLGDHGGKSVA